MSIRKGNKRAGRSKSNNFPLQMAKKRGRSMYRRIIRDIWYGRDSENVSGIVGIAARFSKPEGGASQ